MSYIGRVFQLPCQFWNVFLAYYPKLQYIITHMLNSIFIDTYTNSRFPTPIKSYCL